MPYKDPEKRKECRRRNAHKHREYYRDCARAYRAKHPEREAASNKRYRTKKSDEVKARKAAYYATHPITAEQRARKNALLKARRAANPERYRLSSRRQYAANPQKASENQKRYRAKHLLLVRERSAAHESRRRAAKMAFSTWPENDALFELIYAEAAYRRLEVDHVVPLNGRRVCGLHVYYNIQLLTRSQNAAKGNHFPTGVHS